MLLLVLPLEVIVFKNHSRFHGFHGPFRGFHGQSCALLSSSVYEEYQPLYEDYTILLYKTRIPFIPKIPFRIEFDA